MVLLILALANCNLFLVCFTLETNFRKNELYQVAQQASNIEDLGEVIRASLSVMSKQWSDAMHTFNEKFNALPSLIIDHGNVSISKTHNFDGLFAHVMVSFLLPLLHRN